MYPQDQDNENVNTDVVDEDAEAAAQAAAELDEVDVPTETDEVDEPAAQPKTVKKVKANTRPAPAPGTITPVAFAKSLSKRLTDEARAAGRIKEDEEIEVPPQMIYSYLNAAKKENAKDGLPSYSSKVDGTLVPTKEKVEGETYARDNLLKEDEAFAWWDRKEQRKAQRASGGGVKKVKPQAAAEAPTETEESTEVVEAE